MIYRTLPSWLRHMAEDIDWMANGDVMTAKNLIVAAVDADHNSRALDYNEADLLREVSAVAGFEFTGDTVRVVLDEVSGLTEDQVRQAAERLAASVWPTVTVRYEVVYDRRSGLLVDVVLPEDVPAAVPMQWDGNRVPTLDWDGQPTGHYAAFSADRTICGAPAAALAWTESMYSNTMCSNHAWIVHPLIHMAGRWPGVSQAAHGEGILCTRPACGATYRFGLVAWLEKHPDAQPVTMAEAVAIIHSDDDPAEPVYVIRKPPSQLNRAPRGPGG